MAGETGPLSFPDIGLNFSVPHGRLKVTSGKITISDSGRYLQTGSAGMRAVDTSSDGNIGLLQIIYHGLSSVVKPQANGDVRSQVGLKLRSANPCNLLYVMWRIYPEEVISISRKANPNLETSLECGAGGYTRVVPLFPVPGHATLRNGERRYFGAEIVEDSVLNVYIDNELTRSIDLNADIETQRFLTNTQGVSGIRSDNVDLTFKFKIRRSSDT